MLFFDFYFFQKFFQKVLEEKRGEMGSENSQKVPISVDFSGFLHIFLRFQCGQLYFKKEPKTQKMGISGCVWVFFVIA